MSYDTLSQFRIIHRYVTTFIQFHLILKNVRSHDGVLVAFSTGALVAMQASFPNALRLCLFVCLGEEWLLCDTRQQSGDETWLFPVSTGWDSDPFVPFYPFRISAVREHPSGGPGSSPT